MAGSSDGDWSSVSHLWLWSARRAGRWVPNVGRILVLSSAWLGEECAISPVNTVSAPNLTAQVLGALQNRSPTPYSSFGRSKPS